MIPFDISAEELRSIIAKYVDDPKEQALNASWFDVASADWWRHDRMYEIAECLNHLNYKWLTIGDAKFGLDSLRLMRKGIGDITPTDIMEPQLKASKAEGWIADYRVENAEQLSLPDDSTDVVFCKEAHHHFPHPQKGLYEMIRVARKAVILIEPYDKAAGYSLDAIVRQKKLISHATFEPIGNFVYPLSPREIVKIAIVSNMKVVAFKGLNDYYEEGLEFEVADTRKSAKYKRMRRLISLRDTLCKLRMLDYNLGMFAMFKESADEKALVLLRNKGWTVVHLPQNPYI